MSERRPGRTKLVYDKKRRTIITVPTGPWWRRLWWRLTHRRKTVLSTGKHDGGDG